MPKGSPSIGLLELRTRAVTSQTTTTNFRHLLPANKNILKIGRGNPARQPKVSATKDRIKWWNIVPGDQVRVMAHNDEVIRDVAAINKFSNRVFLKRTEKVRGQLVSLPDSNELCPPVRRTTAS